MRVSKTHFEGLKGLWSIMRGENLQIILTHIIVNFTHLKSVNTRCVTFEIKNILDSSNSKNAIYKWDHKKKTLIRY